MPYWQIVLAGAGLALIVLLVCALRPFAWLRYWATVHWTEGVALPYNLPAEVRERLTGGHIAAPDAGVPGTHETKESNHAAG